MDDLNYHTDFFLIPGEWSAKRAERWLRRGPARAVIIRRHYGSEILLYVFGTQIVLSRLRDRPHLSVSEALELHEGQAVPLVGPETTTQAPAVVINAEGTVVGYTHLEHDLGPMRSVPPTTTFTAYPAIITRERVPAQGSFAVAVGFGDTEDATLSSTSGQLVFRHVAPGDACTIIIRGDGLEFDRAMDTLPLRSNALISFTATPTIESGLARIKLEYYHHKQRIGYAERIVAVGDQPTLPEPEAGAGIQSVEFAAMVDVTLSLCYNTHAGTLEWNITATTLDQPVQWTAPAAIPADQTQQFAADLLRDLRKYQFEGRPAESVLDALGEQLAEYMPPLLWETLHTIYSQKKAPPTLLLLTDEPYIPWELATLPEPLDASKPLFLGAQTVMGRWLSSMGVPAQPKPALNIGQLSVVWSQYGWESGQSELKEAKAEAEFLEQQWQAQPFNATLDDLMPLLYSKPPLDGHLLHFAVHGMSDVKGNAQALILADQKELLPAVLVDRSRSAQGDPRFVFVFINACQVGTAGSSLGQAAGFPGTLLRRKVAGFIAPLWEAHDVEAREMAQQIYSETLGSKHAVGEVLMRLRQAYQPAASTTPMAYIFYGHPALKLNHM